MISHPLRQSLIYLSLAFDSAETVPVCGVNYWYDAMALELSPLNWSVVYLNYVILWNLGIRSILSSLCTFLKIWKLHSNLGISEQS